MTLTADALFPIFTGPDHDPVLASLADLIAAVGTTDLQSQVIANKSLVDATIRSVVATLNASVAIAQSDTATARAALFAEIGDRASADTVINTRIDTVSSAVGSASAAVTSEAATRASQDLALSGRIDTVTAVANGNTASISNEAIARANADSGLASQIASLTTTANGNTAAISNEALARANADSALSALITSLNTSVGNNTAAISSEAIARANADSALTAAINTLQSSTNGSIASINSTLTTQTSTNDAVSAALQSLSTTVGGHTATLTTYGASINGLYLQWGAEFDTNGRITGFKLFNGGGRTNAIFSTDFFGIALPGSGTPFYPFSVDLDGVVKMHTVEIDTLKVGAVGINELAQGAAQRCAFWSTPSDLAIPRAATANVATLTFTKQDPNSDLEVLFFANMNSPDDLQFSGQFILDGNVVQPFITNIILDTTTSNGQMPVTPFAFIPNVGSGQHTLAVNITNNEVDYVDLVVRAGSTIKVVELLKGSTGSGSGSQGGIISYGGGGGGGGGGGAGSF